MDFTELSALLWQSESETLDFKRDQYLFDSASDDQRSELLKDILAFANAWRTSTAHILIGIQEVKGGRGNVVGAQHLLNRTLQTFVLEKVNRPIAFLYEQVEFESKQIGIISIPVQERPFYLRKSYGKLIANTIYIRRGDTTTTAQPDEIALMGAKLEVGRTQPALEFEFADTKKRNKLGSNPQFKTLSFEVPADADIPAYGRKYSFTTSLHGDNEDYLPI